jgi:hypothetical protein
VYSLKLELEALSQDEIYFHSVKSGSFVHLQPDSAVGDLLVAPGWVEPGLEVRGENFLTPRGSGVSREAAFDRGEGFSL